MHICALINRYVDSLFIVVLCLLNIHLKIIKIIHGIHTKNQVKLDENIKPENK